MVDGDVRYRAVGDGPAEVLLRHAERGAQVIIDYQSEADGVVSSAGGNSWKMAAAPKGNQVTVELPPGVDTLTFTSPPDQMKITQLEMRVPVE
jgi:hypothetical protein